jgi:hypothetical protein
VRRRREAVRAPRVKVAWVEEKAGPPPPPLSPSSPPPRDTIAAVGGKAALADALRPRPHAATTG